MNRKYGQFEQVNGSVINEALERVNELELALQDAKKFAEIVECWGRTDCEIYKHELKASADLSLDRISKVLET